MNKAARRRIASAISLVILFPLILPMLLIIGLRVLADGIEWCFDKRWLALVLIVFSERVEVWFMVDAQSDYDEWRTRMKSNEQ